MARERYGEDVQVFIGHFSRISVEVNRGFILGFILAIAYLETHPLIKIYRFKRIWLVINQDVPKGYGKITRIAAEETRG